MKQQKLFLLENPKIAPQNLAAEMRNQFIPLAWNSSAVGHDSNRRIEIILSPQFYELSDLLNQN